MNELVQTSNAAPLLPDALSIQDVEIKTSAFSIHQNVICEELGPMKVKKGLSSLMRMRLRHVNIKPQVEFLGASDERRPKKKVIEIVNGNESVILVAPTIYFWVKNDFSEESRTLRACLRTIHKSLSKEPKEGFNLWAIKIFEIEFNCISVQDKKANILETGWIRKARMLFQANGVDFVGTLTNEFIFPKACLSTIGRNDA